MSKLKFTDKQLIELCPEGHVDSVMASILGCSRRHVCYRRIKLGLLANCKSKRRLNPSTIVISKKNVEEYRQSEKYKECWKKYAQSNERKESQKKYQQSGKYKELWKKYQLEGRYKERKKKWYQRNREKIRLKKRIEYQKKKLRGDYLK